MGELETKITEILNSPEDMQKILNIARSLTGGSSSDTAGDNASKPPPPLSIPEFRKETAPKEIDAPAEVVVAEAEADAEAEAEGEVAQAEAEVEVAEAESDEGENSFDLDFLDNLDINPDMMKAIGSVMGGLSSGSHNRELLDGIKPLLKPERQEQLTKAIKLAGMAKMALGLFGNSSGGD